MKLIKLFLLTLVYASMIYSCSDLNEQFEVDEKNEIIEDVVEFPSNQNVTTRGPDPDCPGATQMQVVPIGTFSICTEDPYSECDSAFSQCCADITINLTSECCFHPGRIIGGEIVNYPSKWLNDCIVDWSYEVSNCHVDHSVVSVTLVEDFGTGLFLFEAVFADVSCDETCARLELFFMNYCDCDWLDPGWVG